MILSTTTAPSVKQHSSINAEQLRRIFFFLENCDQIIRELWRTRFQSCRFVNIIFSNNLITKQKFFVFLFVHPTHTPPTYKRINHNTDVFTECIKGITKKYSSYAAVAPGPKQRAFYWLNKFRRIVVNQVQKRCVQYCATTTQSLWYILFMSFKKKVQININYTNSITPLYNHSEPPPPHVNN